MEQLLEERQQKSGAEPVPTDLSFGSQPVGPGESAPDVLNRVNSFREYKPPLRGSEYCATPQTLLHKTITRTMKLLTRRGVLIEDQGSTYVVAYDANSDEVSDVSFAASNSMA